MHCKTRWILTVVVSFNIMACCKSDEAIAYDFRHRLQGHERTVWAMSFSPSGDNIACGSDDSTISVWSCKEGKKLFSNKLDICVRQVSYSPNGSFLSASDEEGLTKIWRSQNFEHILDLHDDREAIFTQDGKYLITSGEMGPSKVYFCDTINVGKIKKVEIYEVGNDPIEKYYLGTNAGDFGWKTHFVGSLFEQNYKVENYLNSEDLKSGSVISIPVNEDTFCAINKNTSELFMVRKGKMSIIKIETGVYSLSDDRNYIIIGGNRGKIQIIELSSATTVFSGECPIADGSSLSSVRTSSDLNWLAAASKNGDIFIWKRKNNN